MLNKRQAGILLHPTSLPGPYGIGDLGYEAYRFVDFLKEAGQKLWQVLPLGPTGYGDSPYQCFSAFAGNPLLISPDILVEEKLLELDDLQKVPHFDVDKIDYGQVIDFKFSLLRKAFENFRNHPKMNKYFNDEIWDDVSRYWLDDYALFMSCKNFFGGQIWANWDEEIAFRKPGAVDKWSEKLKDEIEFQKFIQYLFFEQWIALKNYANEKGLNIIGDLPIYVSYDSSDVWSNPALFSVDAKGALEKVAGVPPDYFSPTGQLWGNPIYKWDKMTKDNFEWWKKRFNNLYNFVDIARIDHFRGFEAYYEISGDAVTAENGIWVKAPGKELFTEILKYLGDLPIIAEDLGVITPEVDELRNFFNLPGMRILQFAFGESGDIRFLPHNHQANTVVYTGSHDNETTVGFFERECYEENNVCSHFKNYVNLKDDNYCEALIRTAYSSVANTAIIPMQDFLMLDNKARMNFPGRPYGNWTWRFTQNSICKERITFLKNMVELYER